MFVLTIALALACTAVLSFATAEYVAGATFAALAVMCWTSVRSARLAFCAGYLAARSAMYRSLGEAQSRGLSPGEWLVAEIERDGLTIRFEPDEDD